MSAADVKHPTLCEKNCGYNFCAGCVELLIESSKSRVEMASDGNMAVKVKLHCPQCRSNLSSTIDDTLLLRRFEEWHKLCDEKDSELSGAELRQKVLLESGEVSATRRRESRN